MKFYKCKESKELTHILLESLEEVNLFLANKDMFWNQSFKDFSYMNGFEKVSRARLISHTRPQNAVTALAGVHSAMLNYSIPVSINVVNDFYNNEMLKFFHIKNNVFVNKVGGYMYKEGFNLEQDFDLLEEFSIEDFFNKDNISFEYDISESKVLVFENDPSLDPWTVNFFNNSRVPYICNLRDVLASNKFEETCTKFTKYYSKKAFIYTTGLDFDQIIDYTQRAYDCGFNNFTWYFNTAENFNRESELVDFLSKLNITYTINYVQA